MARAQGQTDPDLACALGDDEREDANDPHGSDSEGQQANSTGNSRAQCRCLKRRFDIVADSLKCCRSGWISPSHRPTHLVRWEVAIVEQQVGQLPCRLKDHRPNGAKFFDVRVGGDTDYPIADRPSRSCEITADCSAVRPQHTRERLVQHHFVRGGVRECMSGSKWNSQQRKVVRRHRMKPNSPVGFIRLSRPANLGTQRLVVEGHDSCRGHVPVSHRRHDVTEDGSIRGFALRRHDRL